MHGEFKLPFLEGLKSVSGCSYEYMSHAEFHEGQTIGRRIGEAVATSYGVEELRREIEALKARIENQNIEIEALRNEVNRKDNRWGQF